MDRQPRVERVADYVATGIALSVYAARAALSIPVRVVQRRLGR